MVFRQSNVADTYEEAKRACEAKVKCIVEDCQRDNLKFTDSEFNIEMDFLLNGGTYTENCRYSLRPNIKKPGLKQDVPLNDQDKPLASITTSSTSADRGNKCVGPKSENESMRTSVGPQSVHRASYIFNGPTFVDQSFASSNIRQGNLSNC